MTHSVYSPDGQLMESIPPSQEAANAATLRDQADEALAVNRSFIADTSVTQAEAVAHIKALCRQVNALIRLTLNDLDGTD